ncbi:MAG: MarR family transcriptional regulator [Actinomycetota bacterium]|nr:MarR family transcriptional regulator [Actinomycetota bacterium]
MARRLTPTDSEALIAAEQDVRARLTKTEPPLDIDFPATAVIANVFRIASAARSVFERRVLGTDRLSFTAFTVLWVLWIWGEQEFRHVASESGITKGTLTGVLTTLEGRGLVSRRRLDSDRRMVMVAATEEAEALMQRVFPAVNEQESEMVSRLDRSERDQLARLLRQVLRQLDADVMGDDDG